MAASAARSACLSCVMSVSSFAAPPKEITWPRSSVAHGVDLIERGFFGVGEPVALAHAERIVDREHHGAAAVGAGDGGRVNVRTRERQHEQQHEQAAQREQQQILQPAMLDGALRAPLEEHQRAERHGLLAVLPKQMNVDRQAQKRRGRRETMARGNPTTSSSGESPDSSASPRRAAWRYS